MSTYFRRGDPDPFHAAQISNASLSEICGALCVIVVLAITTTTGKQSHSGQLLRRFAPRVAMMQATEARHGGHVCGRGWLWLDCSSVRCVLF